MNELTIHHEPPAKQIELWKKGYCKDANNDEIVAFINFCKRTGLSPDARQVYAIRRSGILRFETSIDGLRLVADRTKKYQGQVGPYFTDDGKWMDCWLKDAPPKAAKIGVLKEGFKEPLFAVARYESYAQPSPTWKKMPDIMLAKCAEALALRKAFPQELSGLYTEDEMPISSREHETIEIISDDPIFTSLPDQIRMVYDYAKSKNWDKEIATGLCVKYNHQRLPMSEVKRDLLNFKSDDKAMADLKNNE